MNSSVEIVIVSYNRHSALTETLRHLRRLYPSVPVCLGIQGEEPPKKFINDFILNQPSRLIHYKEPSVTRTLNSCIKSSKAEICLLLDDDAWPCCGWLEGHLGAYDRDPELLYTVGREIRTSKGRSFGKEIFRYFIESLHGFFSPPDAKLCGRLVGWATKTGFVFGNFDLPGQAAVNSARGCNMSLRRETFLGLGGFNENFKGNAWGFETEFTLRAQDAGKLGRYLGQAAVLHHEVESGGTRSQQGQTYMRDFKHNQGLVKKQMGSLAVLGNTVRSLGMKIKKRRLS